MSWHLTTTAQRVHQPGRNRARARGTEQEQIGSQRRILPSDTGWCIACEGSSGRDWPGRNFFGAALCSAFSLERKARVGWWDVSLVAFSAVGDSARALRLARSSISLFPTADHAQTFSSSSLTPSPTHHALRPPLSLSPPPHKPATMVHTNGNVAKGETFLYVQHPANNTTIVVPLLLACTRTCTCTSCGHVC